jgi:pimeloyl-ACP methyl ester carboxylesterase
MRPTIAALALALSSSSAGLAQTATASVDSAGPHPASVSTVGAFRVERYGAGSPALVFIPGLSCGSWVWDGAVKRFAATHAVYVVTLAGFDGLPAPAAPTLDAADASLLQLITSQKLDRPIVVGHSMGGFLALRFGTEHSALVRGIVSVDGLPVFPTLAQSTADQRAAAAKAIAAQIGGATPEQYAAEQKQTIGTMVTEPTNVDHVAALSAKSDPKAVAAYMSDLLASDLRPALPSMTAPTLEIAPVPTVPAPFEGPQAATASMADREAGYKQFYASLFPGAPNVTIEMVPNSKHFVMVDQPQTLYDDIGAFIAKVS